MKPIDELNQEAQPFVCPNPPEPVKIAPKDFEAIVSERPGLVLDDDDFAGVYAEPSRSHPGKARIGVTGDYDVYDVDLNREQLDRFIKILQELRDGLQKP